MTKVSITDFRDNLATYLRLAKYKGKRVVIFDEKIGEPMAELTPLDKKEGDKDWDTYMKFVEGMFGAWKDYPKDKNRADLRRADKTRIKKRTKR